MTKQEFEIKTKEFKEIFGFKPPVSKFLEACGLCSLDIVELDSKIPNYDGDRCTYKGKPGYSLSRAIKEEYGKRASDLIDEMCTL